MPESHMVEPDSIASLWMRSNRWTHLTSAQTIILFPLESDRIFVAVILHHSLICCVKGFLPGQTKAVVIVADQHPPALFELVLGCRAQAFVDVANIGNRCFASLGRRTKSKKPDFERKSCGCRELVMLRNRL